MSDLDKMVEKVKRLDDSAIEALFENRPYVYFITIKPPRGDSKLKNVTDLCSSYLRRRDVDYWIVPSKSDTDYDHYHGIIALQPDIGELQKERFKSAFQRKVNRCIGFSLPLQQVQDLKGVIRYVQQQRTTDYDFASSLPPVEVLVY